MHDADNEVTQADREAAAKLSKGNGCNWYAPSVLKGILDGTRDDVPLVRAFARHRLASIEAACRKKDAEIEGWRQKWIRSTDRCRDMKHERDQLRAKLDEAGQILMAVVDFEEDHTDPACQDKHPFLARARAFLASAPQPTPPASEEG